MISFQNQCDFPWNRLDVRFTKACDNKCSFCVERSGINTICNPNIKKMIETTNSVSDVDTIGILGGEPLLFPEQVLKYVKGVKTDNNRVYITTSLPITIKNKKNTVYKIFDLVDGINVSVLGIDWKEHNKVLNASNHHNRFKMIEELACRFPFKLRICINFYKGGIDTKEKLFKLLDKLNSYNVLSIKLNEIQWDASGYVSFEDLMGIKKMKSAYAFGCYKELTNSELNEKYPNIKFSLHRSCCFTQPSVSMSWFDIIKDFIKIIRSKFIKNKFFGVIYEDGELSSKWLKL